MIYRVSISLYATDSKEEKEIKKSWCRQEVGRIIFKDLPPLGSTWVQLEEEYAALAFLPEDRGHQYTIAVRVRGDT